MVAWISASMAAPASTIRAKVSSAAPVRTGMRVPPPPSSLPEIEDGDEEFEEPEDEAVEA